MCKEKVIVVYNTNNNVISRTNPDTGEAEIMTYDHMNNMTSYKNTDGEDIEFVNIYPDDDCDESSCECEADCDCCCLRQCQGRDDIDMDEIDGISIRVDESENASDEDKEIMKMVKERATNDNGKRYYTHDEIIQILKSEGKFDDFYVIKSKTGK